MSGTNEFQPFAKSGTANVLSPADYAAKLSLLANGFQAGVAKSEEINTVFRQASFVAAAMAQIIANNNVDALDDGDLASFVSAFMTAVLSQGVTQPQFDNSLKLATTAFVRNELMGLGNVVYASLFGSGLGTNGYQKLPSGKIEQWAYQATGTTLAGNMMVTMPTTFPNVLLSAVAVSANGTGASPTVVGIGDDSTTSQLRVTFAANTLGVFIHVIGK